MDGWRVKEIMLSVRLDDMCSWEDLPMEISSMLKTKSLRYIWFVNFWFATGWCYITQKIQAEQIPHRLTSLILVGLNSKSLHIDVNISIS